MDARRRLDGRGSGRKPEARRRSSAWGSELQRVGDGWGSPPVVRVKSPCLLENSSIAVGSVFPWNSLGTLAVVKAERPGHRIPASRSINRRTPVLRSAQVRFTE